MKPCLSLSFLVLGVLALLTILTGCNGVGAQPPSSSDESSALPFSGNELPEISKGTPVYVRLQQSISNTSAQSGETFSAVLDEPLMVNGKIVVPEGAQVKGEVVSARKYERLHHAGYLRLTLSSITVKGKEIPIQTTSVFVEGGSFKNKNLAYVGSGSGSKSLIGELIGAPFGSTHESNAAYAKGTQEVGFTSKGRLNFCLMRPLNAS